MRVPPLATVFLVLVAACSHFEPLPPADDVGAEGIEATRPPLPERERLIYRGTWNGVPAGEADLLFQRKGDEYVCKGRLETIGLVSLLYGLNAKAESVASADGLVSRRWSYATEGEDDPKVVDVRFDLDSGRVLCIKRKGEDVSRIVHDAPGALDPIVTISALRRADLVTGTEFRTDLVTEWYVYRADTRVVGPERVSVPAGEFDTVFVRIDLTKIVDGRPEEDSRGMGIWFTDDPHRVPVRIDADTKIGRIRISLTHHSRGWPKWQVRSRSKTFPVRVGRE
jgi:hypothetical protein